MSRRLSRAGSMRLLIIGPAVPLVVLTIAVPQHCIGSTLNRLRNQSWHRRSPESLHVQRPRRSRCVSGGVTGALPDGLPASPRRRAERVDVSDPIIPTVHPEMECETSSPFRITTYSA